MIAKPAAPGGRVDPRLLRRARAARSYLAVCVGLGVASAVLIIAQATLIADAVTAAFRDGAGLDRLGTPVVLLGAVAVGRAGIAWATEAAAQRASAAVKSQLRTDLLRSLTRLRPGLPGRRTGELTMLATRGVDALDGYFARYLPQLVLAAVVPAAVCARILAADGLSAVIIIVTLPLIPVFMVLVGRTTQRRMDRQWRSLSRLSGHFLEVVAGLPTLKVFGRAKAQAEVVRAATDRYRRATMGTLRVAFLSALVLELLATLSVALVAVSVGLRLVDGALDLRTGLLVLVLAPEAYLPLRQVGARYHDSAEGLAAAREVFETLDAAAALSPAGRSVDAGFVTAATIRFESVTVRYSGRTESALDAVDAEIRPGEVLGITGPSGAGKSTLLALLLRFREPDSGRITVGVTDLAELDVNAWRRQLSWVPQRPHLFAGTVADNVRLARPEASEAEVAQAARDAELDLPLDTAVGECGTAVSGGQRRRIALARALLRPAPLLLLDEPTESLDAATEASVLARLRARAPGRAVVLVAHRPTLLAACDRVITLPARGDVAPEVAA